jgi:hypothetical protein
VGHLPHGLGEAALSNPGFTGDNHGATVAAMKPVEPLREGLELVAAADKSEGSA